MLEAYGEAVVRALGEDEGFGVGALHRALPARPNVEAAGATMADIVKLNTYIVAAVDPAEVPKMRAIRNRYVNTEKPPASTLVVVTRLAQPGWLIEVEAVAAIDT